VAISRPTYCSREIVKRALDVAETSRNDAQVDRAIEASSDGIDGGAYGGNRGAGLLKRRFYPEVKTVTFDWPADSRPWRLWLGQHDLISVTSLTAGGETIAASDYFLRPDDGPPHDRIEIDLASSAAFASGDTHQRAVSIVGLWGFGDDDATAGTLAAAVSTTTATTVDVSDAGAAGVGDLIKAGSERMLVVGRQMLDTTQNLQANLNAADNHTTVAVTNGAAFAVDEVILLDSERMLVTDIAGNNLTVRRAWDGTVLATHSGSDIYASRRLTVTRGVLGTTAATHASGAALVRQVYPGLVRDLAAAEAINQLLQETSGYARAGGVQDNSRRNTISESNIRSHKHEIGLGLDALRARAVATYGRKARKAAV
jgi:hypothetical protein